MPFCGIDLGTTYSSVACYLPENRRVENIDLYADGGQTLRSVVYFEPGGNVIVGEAAHNAAVRNADRVVVGIKRAIGNSDWTRSIDGREYTASEISAEILKTLKNDAELYLGEPVEDVVITVPAHFGDNERAATEEAGRLAGLNVLELIAEPHAAAFAFAVDHAGEIGNRDLLVYDLGGGTFDVTLIRTQSQQLDNGAFGLQIKTLCKEGHRSLGGLDWDGVLAEMVAQQVTDEHGYNPKDDPGDNATLLDNCERAKRNLSTMTSASVTADLKAHFVDVTRSLFEQASADLLLQSEVLIEEVLKEAEEKHGVKRADVQVLLCGGSTRMPAVAEMITRVMGRPPMNHRNPELLVASGAAYRAYIIGVEQGQVDGVGNGEPVIVTGSGDIVVGPIEDIGMAVGVEVIDVTNVNGKRVETRRNHIVVDDGSTYGQTFDKTFYTQHENQTEILLKILEGKDPDPEKCHVLAELEINGLPPGRPAGCRVDVQLGYDVSGIIRGMAQDMESEKSLDIEIDRSKT